MSELGTRAVLRPIEPGNEARCPTCGEEVKFKANIPAGQRRQVIANVYEAGKWSRVEHYHCDCYATAGQPHGTPTGSGDRVLNA